MMSKMPCYQAICLSFVMFMIIGMVNGRLLEFDIFPPSMISDRNSDQFSKNHPKLREVVSNSTKSTTLLYAEKRCQSIYGFLPCANTLQEGVFLMLTYTYLMMLGEDLIQKGSHDLFFFMGNQRFGASVFRVLRALPRIVIVIVTGILATSSDAQNKVAFGVAMYAGSTVITLTLIWGMKIILSRDKLRGRESAQKDEHQKQPSTAVQKKKQLSTKCLTNLNETGVNIDAETGKIAVIMLLSLVPFATVELVSLSKTRLAMLFALVVSFVSLLVYFIHQIWHPWIQARSLAYLKQENLQTRFIYHVKRLVGKELDNEDGKPNVDAFKSVFDEADTNKDGYISHDELEQLIHKVFELEKDLIAIEYAKAEILTNFDSDKSGKIDWPEFKKGCTKWLEKSKKVADNPNSVSKHLWKQVRIAVDKNRSKLSKIENIMPRILHQSLKKHELLTHDGNADREKIDRLISGYDKNKDKKICPIELKKFIEETVYFGVSLDHDMVYDEVINDFDNDADKSIDIEEFVNGFVKWIEKATNHDPRIKDPKHAIEKFEEACWAEIDSHMKMDNSKATIIYGLVGVGIISLISGAFVQSVIQFSTAAHIPFLYTSFVITPLAMKTKMIIKAVLDCRLNLTKNASLTFTEIYSEIVMENLLGLSTLLGTIYIKGLSWNYSALTIMMPCTVVGLYALKRDTYPLWASFFQMLLYPVSIYIYYILKSKLIVGFKS